MAKKSRKTRNLSVPEKHLLAIAKKTLKMNDTSIKIMGGPNRKEAEEIVRRLS
jgi:hypothetical protein